MKSRQSEAGVTLVEWTLLLLTVMMASVGGILAYQHNSMAMWCDAASMYSQWAPDFSGLQTQGGGLSPKYQCFIMNHQCAEGQFVDVWDECG